jgi:DNA modification methylase
MVAFALRGAGWWLRQDIIWSKPNPMPESVTDRCTKAHEYLFLLSKADGNKERKPASARRASRYWREDLRRSRRQRAVGRRHRNKRSVWTVTTQPFKEAHFATFPPALIEPCILAGARPAAPCSTRSAAPAPPAWWPIATAATPS